MSTWLHTVLGQSGKEATACIFTVVRDPLHFRAFDSGTDKREGTKARIGGTAETTATERHRRRHIEMHRLRSVILQRGPEGRGQRNRR
mmetsp:Transcript_9039/g.17700  ORF Transcript_9039/g.17700 Transcript_9039/m.17700 type:complete len:88 (+) Transcript_9039:2020-2283(+)